MSKPLVGIIMGSDSDLPVVNSTIEMLTQMGVGAEVRRKDMVKS